MQRRGAVHLRRIYVGVPIEQGANALGVVFPGGIRQR